MMLSSHHWPGMMFDFLLLLLTSRGAEICCSCFLDVDVKEPNYDWDSAPAFDLENVYKPLILCQHVNHGNDIHHTLTGNSDNEVQKPGGPKQQQESHHHELQPLSVFIPGQKSSRISCNLQVWSTIVWSRLISQ
jgi:hypothetical protein